MGACWCAKKKIVLSSQRQSQSIKMDPKTKSYIGSKSYLNSPVEKQAEKGVFPSQTEKKNITFCLKKPTATIKLQNQVNQAVQSFTCPLLETPASKKYTFIRQHKSNSQIQVVQNNRTGKHLLVENIEKLNDQNEKYIVWLQNQHLDHPNIIKAIEIHQDRLNYQVVFENFQGASLQLLIHEGVKVPKKFVSQICDQILSALSYLHSQNIVHGNLTMRSFEFIQKDNKYLVKLVNLKGIRMKEENNIEIMTLLPPECLYKQHLFTKERDIWAVGLICLTLRQGQIPYNLPQKCLIPTMLVIMKEHKFIFYKKKDDIFRVFLESILVRDPYQRKDADQLLKQKFIQNYRIKEIPQQEVFLKNFLQNSPCCLILQLILQFFAQQFCWIQYLQILKLFGEGDTKIDGLLSKQELKKLISTYLKVDQLNEKLSQIFTLFELEQNDGINQTQFLSLAVDRQKLLTPENIETTFYIFSQGKPDIILRGLKRYLQCGTVNLKQEFAELTNEYNFLNFEQFQLMITSLLK